MASYNEELARWRMQRRQAEISDRVEQIRQEHAEVSRERDTALANGDVETAEWRDKDCEQLEAEYQQYVPPRSPFSQQDIAFLQKKTAYREKYGPAADALIARAHRQAVMPRNPHATSATNPDTYGSGLRPGTPAYYKAVDNYLELYAKDFDAPYDPKEDSVDWKQAARASGVSEKTYLDSYRALKAQGRIK
jgi:hypothetical protein